MRGLYCLHFFWHIDFWAPTRTVHSALLAAFWGFPRLLLQNCKYLSSISSKGLRPLESVLVIAVTLILSASSLYQYFFITVAKAWQIQTREGKTGFGSHFHAFSLWLLGLEHLSRASWRQEYVTEKSCLCHSWPEAESNRKWPAIIYP